jgi:ribonuclease-3
MVPPPELRDLLALLGVDREVPHLEEALTHRSWVNEHPGARDYQRLEFLGDAVLGLCVSQMLHERLPDATEGRLTRLRAALVNTHALAAFAADVDLGRFVRFGRGTLASGDAARDKVLADVVEALIGALYLDGGLEAAVALTRRVVGEALSQHDRLGAPDPKSQLQECVQREGRAAPSYRTVHSSGPDHERRFEVEVLVDGEVLARGAGRSKKLAERAAAHAALSTHAAPTPEEPT